VFGHSGVQGTNEPATRVFATYQAAMQGWLAWQFLNRSPTLASLLKCCHKTSALRDLVGAKLRCGLPIFIVDIPDEENL